jgi:RHS repeat-associated protein
MLYDSGTARMTGKTSTPSKPAGSGGSIPASKSRVYNYQALSDGEIQTPGDFRPRTTTTTLGSVVVGTSFFSARKVDGSYVETKEHTKSSTGTYGDTANIKEEKKWYGSGANIGRIEQVLAKDGTLTRYEYNAKTDNRLEVITYRMLSASGSPVSGHSTRTTELRDSRAWPTEITSATYINNAWVNYQTITEVRNSAGRLTDRIRKDLLTNQTRVLLHQEWDGPNLTRAVDEEGVAMVYTYFPNTNILESSLREAVPAQDDLPAQSEILTTYSGEFTMNQAQVPVWRQRLTTITADGLTLTESHTFDEKNRVVSHTDTSGYTTSTSYTEDDKLITVTLPSGATRITAKDSDGRTLSITGTAVVSQFFHYAPVVGGGQSLTVYTGQDNGPRYLTTITDGADRVTKTIRPAFGGGTEVTEYVYSPAFPNSVTTVTSSGKATKVCELNSVGLCELEGLTADNATLSLNSATDRIVDTVTTTEQDAGGIWRVTRTSTYAQEDSAQSKLVNTSRVKLAGFTGTQVSHSESIDISNNTTTQTTTLTGNLRETRIARPGVAAEEISVSYADRLTYLYQPGIADPHIFGYDSLGRKVSSKQPRHTQAAITAYFLGSDLIETETDAAQNPTNFTYQPQGSNGAGKIKTITLADGTVQYRGYTPRGEIKVTWGTQTYPTWNVYDSYGQLNHLHTWQVAPAFDIDALPADPPDGSALTTWNYDPATGLLANKRDATLKGADYQYDVARRLTKRTWARSHDGVRLVTDYIPNAFGDITNINYSDDTPDVTIVPDRLGRRFTVTQANQSQIEYHYDPVNLALDTETIRYDLDPTAGYEFTRVLDRSRDPINRDNGFQLKSITTTGNQVVTDIETEALYAFSPTDGRVSQISNPQLANQIFDYDYFPNSNLLGIITGPAHTVINTYEQERDVLDIKQNKRNNLAETVVSQYDYFVNEIGQRKSVATSGTAFGVAPVWNWGYNPRGELVSARDTSANSRDLGYIFDAIGNRVATGNVYSIEEGVEQVTNPVAYTANALNQYDVAAGVPLPTAPAPAPYDLDGNLRFDGGVNLTAGTESAAEHQYIWDAENRLIEVAKVTRDPEDPAEITSTSLVTYAYDSLSRRIRRTDVAAETTTWYLYDGFNCIAEYTGSTPALARTQTWGLDLSGSLQGAGGVGGLLAVNIGGTSYYPTFDGNGNVSEYLNHVPDEPATTEVNEEEFVVSAHFEYDPFGNTVVNTDNAIVPLFAYRFSTKPIDLKTGLYYYTYRYYDPITGRWPSRDPVGEGLQSGELNLSGFIRNRPSHSVDYLGLREIMDMSGWSNKWAKRNPNSTNGMDRSQRESFRKNLYETLRRGCIGLTCVELGEMSNPNLQHCFKAKEQAEKKQEEMAKSKECCGENLNGDPSKPRIFSVHFWNDKGEDGKNPDVNFDKSGKADMTNWDYEAQPCEGNVNFDYGYLESSGTMIHANHADKPNDPMIIYRSSLEKWGESNRDFNSEVWCVACEGKEQK